jgi:DNA-binding MarR family transcriptional regulator
MPAPDTSPTAEAALLAGELRQAVRPIIRRQLSEGGLSFGKVGVLQYLLRHERSTPAELAIAEHVRPQSMTALLRELEDLGLVVRSPDANDGRRVWVRLSDEGVAQLLRQRRPSTGWLVDAVSEILTDDDRALLAAALPVLRKLTGEPALDDDARVAAALATGGTVA